MLVARYVCSLTAMSCGLIANGQNLALNGGFENGPPTNMNSFVLIQTGSPLIANWNVLGDVQYAGLIWNAAEGTHAVHLNSPAGPGAIEQSLPTSPGTTYRVRFMLAGHPNLSPLVKELRVLAPGLTAHYEFNVLGYYAGFMGWREHELIFTASSGLSTIRFESLTTTAGGPAIDDLRIESITTICTADVDDGTATGTPDGGVTIEDLLFYLGMFDDGDIRADVDDGSFTGIPDGGVTIDDLLYFLFRFDAGC